MNRILPVAVLTIAWLATLAGCTMVGGGTPAPTPTPVAESAIPISAKGVVRSTQQQKLSFRASGQIASLPKVGDRIEVNQEIAVLSAPDLDLAVTQAEDGVAVARALLEQAKAPPRAVDVAALEAAYTAAQAQHRILLASPSTADLDAARSAVTAAQSAVDAAKATQSALKSGAAKADVLAAQSNVRNAEANLAVARAKLKALETGPTDDQKAASAAQVDQAKAALDLRKAGPAAADLAVLEARLKQAETALQQAKSARATALLVAPASGVVVWVGPNVGEMAAAGAPVVEIADPTRLVVETTDLDESGAVKLAVGGPAKVSFNALGEKQVEGTISAISPLATTTPSGDAYYAVTISLPQPDPAVRIGMTAKAEFLPSS